MRQIVLDTETTGISPEAGHRIIEIGCIELFNRKRTGKTFHTYLNPKRAVDDGAFRVHGISTDFLKDKPSFKKIAHDLMAFLEGAELIIHNAPFDLGFLIKELSLMQWPKTFHECCSVLDTLVLARKKHPGQRNTLDALCKRYDVNNSNRQYHGALLDAELLTAVYLAMTGGQGSLFEEEGIGAGDADSQGETLIHAQVHENNSIEQAVETFKNLDFVMPLSPDELSRHEEFLEFLKKKSTAKLWD